MGTNQITAGSKEITTTIQMLHQFERVALRSTDDLNAVKAVHEPARTVRTSAGGLEVAEIPEQGRVKAIKSQQTSLSRERERMIQGIQEHVDSSTTTYVAAVRGIFVPKQRVLRHLCYFFQYVFILGQIAEPGSSKYHNVLKHRLEMLFSNYTPPAKLDVGYR